MLSRCPGATRKRREKKIHSTIVLGVAPFKRQYELQTVIAAFRRAQTPLVIIRAYLDRC